MTIREYLRTPLGVANWQKYTPADTIKLVANKEGAAHLESRQNELLEDIKSTFVVNIPVPGFQATDGFVLRTIILQIAEWCVWAIEDLLASPLGSGNEAGAG